MVNNAKLDLGRTLNSHGPHGSRGGNTCHHYGSVSGCDVGCPALWGGECEVIAEVVESIDISEEELLELGKKYNPLNQRGLNIHHPLNET